MPKLSPIAVPAYRRHKVSGQAVVTLDGRDFYLGTFIGTFNSAVSKAEYARLTGEWLAGGRRLPSDPNQVTIAELVVAFRRHALDFYRDADGRVSRAVVNFDDALKPVVKLYAKMRAAQFGPLRLKARGQLLGSSRPGHWRGREPARLAGLAKGRKTSGIVRRQRSLDAVADPLPEMQQCRQSGESFAAIPEALNAADRRTARGNEWQATQVKRALDRAAILRT